MTGLLQKQIEYGRSWPHLVNRLITHLSNNRVLTSSDCFRPHHTIVFVAFDTEEAGSVGSYEFVRRLVVPFFANRNLEMSGAIILDTLINYDPKPGKQTIKKEWEKSMPKCAKEVLENENRGDFIATIRRY